MDDHGGAGYYRRRSQDYDASAARTMALRQRVIARLALQPGDVVVDAGCGTGLSFEALSAAVGIQGQVIGVEASPPMMALARQRVLQMRLDNVILIEGPLETARWPVQADALLFNYVHDILRSPPALDSAMRQARAGARVAAAGIKHPPRWLDPLRLYRRWKSRDCYTRYEGLDAPWDLLGRHLAGLQVESTLWGTGYIAWGERAVE
jgi:demethylmenaquinone methyltransferase/2-methoxy-6-polyprenyl-1,4-benzoquinol methylase